MSNKNEQKALLQICAKCENKPEFLIEILHQVQESIGYLSDENLKLIANALNMSRAEVYGVVTFYKDFRREPVGNTIIKICLAEACQAAGCVRLKSHAEALLSVTMGETTSDGEITLEPVYCLGNCALGPAILINDMLHGRVTEDLFDSLVSGARS